jgi:BolA protein
MTTEDTLRERLQSLNPDTLEIIDESHLHAGHAGNTGGGHFNVFIVSEQFSGLLPLKRHRLVFDAVGDLMQQKIHALSIKAKTPAEFNG